ncbi:MAG: Rieske 2Fe-2S domain-containing protein [Mariniphaga sp.]
MKRKEFFTALGVSAGTVMFAPFLVSCSKGSSVADPGTGGTPGGTVDFTLDLTLPANAALNTVGSSLINSANGIIIACVSAGNYVAVASICTHQGAQIGFDGTVNQFKCSNTGAGHGSVFSTSGSVVAGPAPRGLKLYNATLSGTKLRVFA